MTGAQRDTVTTNFRTWCDAVASGDVDRVVSLYASDVTFLPTLSERFMRNTDDVRAYFIRFLAKQPHCTCVEEVTQMNGADMYVHSGLYDFTFGAGHTRHTQARFTFVWQRRPDGTWVDYTPSFVRASRGRVAA